MKIDILLIPLAIVIQLIFLFKRELLTDKLWEKWIWFGVGVLFVIGFIGKNYYQNIKILPLLMMPIMTYGIFKILLIIYRNMYGKTPVDTFYSMDLKLMKSGIFNFIFWVLGIIIPAIVIYQ